MRPCGGNGAYARVPGDSSMQARRALFVLFLVGGVVAQSAAEVDAAFAAAQPPLTEARWTLVPWRHSLTEALAEARATDKPVYLFVNDGDVESGRC